MNTKIHTAKVGPGGKFMLVNIYTDKEERSQPNLTSYLTEVETKENKLKPKLS